MGLDDTQSERMDLSALLQGIEEGELGVPEFQRDFDWGVPDVKALLVTILNDWPAGSLLLLNAKSSPLRTRGFEGGPQPSDPRLVVLDGQQRLTALYQALYNTGDAVYALSYAELGEFNLDSLEESLVAFDRSVWNRGFREPRAQLAASLVPMYALKSAADFFDWRDRILAVAPDAERRALNERLTALYRSSLAGVHRYRFPTVTLPASVSPLAVARIFERVNKTGISLGPFDLVVARTYVQDWNQIGRAHV